jgi:hypothetical protein
VKSLNLSTFLPIKKHEIIVSGQSGLSGARYRHAGTFKGFTVLWHSTGYILWAQVFIRQLNNR